MPVGDAAFAPQYVPAVQGFAVADVLPIVVQKPAAHAMHVEVPPAEKVPAAQRLELPTVWPAMHQ